MENIKERIKNSLPLEEYLRREGHTLTPSGRNTFMTLCPFHDDKTPSLSVDTVKQLYHCFGCEEGGDIFNYVMKKRNLKFNEAVNYLAENLNIRGPVKKMKISLKQKAAPEPTGIDPLKRIAILERLTEIYHKNLLESPEALKYLEQRGIGTPEIINTFKPGFSKGNLAEMLSKTGEELEILEALGIIRRLKNRFGKESLFEVFKDCIIFPIMDSENHVVEIYGRAINEEAIVKHRYLKGKHEGVFNSKAFKVFEEIIITEGIIDALSFVRLGFKNVTASFGTQGFTENHLKLMEESNTRKVVIAYDNDGAGKLASRKLSERLKQEGFINSRILTLPEEFKDINELLMKSPEAGQIIKSLMEGSGDIAQKIMAIPAGKASPEEMKDLVESVVNDGQEKDYIIEGTQPESPSQEIQLPASNIIIEGSRSQNTALPSNIIEGSREMKQLPNGDFEFTADGFTYRLRGIKEDFESSLKAGVRVHYGEETNFFYDSVNLYSARMRAIFANTIGARFEVSFETILSHLEMILDKLEKERDSQILSNAGAMEVSLTDDEKAIGLKLLASPDLLDEVRNDLSTLGYIGEEMNKVLVYLIATSRKMDEPLASIIISRSSAGKSKLVETVRKLLPEEEVVALSSASDTALYYTTDLSHKFVCLGESKGNENIEYPLRELISSKEITRLVTMKDEKTGQMKGVKIKTKGPIAYIETASRIESLNSENLNRCLVLFVDETQEQTGRILEYQRFLQTPAGFMIKQKIPAIIEKHKAAQKLLQPVLVINPYAELMGFPERRLEARRDQMKFIQVLNAVTFLNQYRRERKKIEDTAAKETFEYIEPALDDYKITYELLVKSGILSNTLSDIPKNARDLYEIIKKMVLEISGKSNKPVKDIHFTRKAVWEYSGWSNFQVRKYMEILLEYELVEVMTGNISGQKHHYRIILEEELERLMLEIIPTPEEMEIRLKKVKKRESV